MSRRIRFILMGLGLVAVAALCWFFLLSPLRGEIASAERDIEDQQQQLSMAKTTLAQSEATREEGRRNQARLLELNKMVPPTEELPSLLLQLQDLADQSGIDFIAVSPGATSAPEDNSGYVVLPLTLEFEGTYFDVSDFAYRAEQMVAGPGRLLAIKNLSLASSGGAAGGDGGVSPKLSVSVSLYAFVLAEPAPPPGPAAPAQSETTVE